MATIAIAGKITCKEGDPAVTLREFGNGGKTAKFNVVDKQYFYVKEGDDRKGQFYSVEVSGKQADIVADRLSRGDRISVTGQLVQRDYNDRTYLDVKQGQVTFLEDRVNSSASGPVF
jgi:single-stranded DNA-binding protein